MKSIFQQIDANNWENKPPRVAALIVKTNTHLQERNHKFAEYLGTGYEFRDYYAAVNNFKSSKPWRTNLITSLKAFKGKSNSQQILNNDDHLEWRKWPDLN